MAKTLYVKRTHSRLLQQAGIDWHLAQALAGGRIDRVGDRGNDCRCPGLAHTTRRLRAFHDVDLNGGRLVHTQHLIGIEVGLLDTAALQRDLAVESSGGAKDDSALDLRLHRVGVDDGTAIDPTHQPLYADGAAFTSSDLGSQ